MDFFKDDLNKTSLIPIDIAPLMPVELSPTLPSVQEPEVSAAKQACDHLNNILDSLTIVMHPLYQKLAWRGIAVQHFLDNFQGAVLKYKDYLFIYEMGIIRIFPFPLVNKKNVLEFRYDRLPGKVLNDISKEVAVDDIENIYTPILNELIEAIQPIQLLLAAQ